MIKSLYNVIFNYYYIHIFDGKNYRNYFQIFQCDNFNDSFDTTNT